MQEFLNVEPALWLFVSVEGMEPTNNAAERAKYLNRINYTNSLAGILYPIWIRLDISL